MTSDQQRRREREEDLRHNNSIVYATFIIAIAAFIDAIAIFRDWASEGTEDWGQFVVFALVGILLIVIGVFLGKIIDNLPKK